MHNLIICNVQYKSKSIHTSLGEIVQAKGNYDTCPLGWVRNVILKIGIAEIELHGKMPRIITSWKCRHALIPRGDFQKLACMIFIVLI